MSLTAPELNYLIYRYFQESGFEIAAYSMESETGVAQLESEYSDVPDGTLIDLVQRGILYNSVKNGDDIKLGNLWNSIPTTPPSENDDGKYNVKEITPQVTEAESTSEKRHDTIPSTSTSTITNTNTNAHTNSIENISTDNEIITKSLNNISPFSSTTGAFCKFSGELAYAIATGVVIIDKDNIQKTTIAALDSLTIAYSNSGKFLATAAKSGEIKIWDNGIVKSVLALHHHPVIIVKFSPNDKYLLSLDTNGVCIIWDVENGSLFMHLDKSKLVDYEGEPSTDAIWLSNDEFIVPLGYSLAVVKVGIGIKGVLKGHKACISSLSYNQDLKLLSSGDERGDIRIWFEGRLVQFLTSGTGIIHLNWSGKDLISSNLDGVVLIWDIETAQIRHSLCVGLPVLSAALDNSHQRISLATTNGVVILQINEQSKKLSKIANWVGHANEVIWANNDTVICNGGILKLV